MNTPHHIRVRFAPSPTGIMHLGNVRAALLNFLFARQHGGTFVLRIEDTDLARNIDQGIQKIIENLEWLGLAFDEGPEKNELYGPYLQSERHHIYEAKRKELELQGLLYRCFCTPEELERAHEEQIARKEPPRYSRKCRNLSLDQIDTHLATNAPFVWRFKLPEHGALTVNDMGTGPINFEAANFSDFPIARQDGSFMFIFSNCIDDIEMKISHIIRGADHLTNSALQVALFNSFNYPVPQFWHLPIICTIEGKKLSKRDRGFSLIDQKEAGFLPQAICNYLGIIGRSVQHEIMSLEELAQSYPFNNLHHTSSVTYDEAKLMWVNQQWFTRLSDDEIFVHLQKFVSENILKNYSPEFILKAFRLIQSEISMLSQFMEHAEFFFNRPAKSELITSVISDENKRILLAQQVCSIAQQAPDVKTIIDQCKALPKMISGLTPKELWMSLRISLAGKPDGVSIAELVELLGLEETKQRLITAFK